MAWKPDYCSVAELKTHLRITDTADDTPLAISVTAASRAIDLACNRQFGVEATAVARYYAWDGECVEGRPALPIDDLMSVSNLAVTTLDADGAAETTLTNATDFDLWPWNAAADSRPWTHMVLRPGAAAYFPSYARSMKVTALYGWTAVPSVVKNAALIQAARFFVRRDAPFGIAGSPDAGSEMRLLSRLDPDVALLVSSVRRVWGAV